MYKNCNPGLALRVYQMMYANSFEEDRFLSTMQREDEAFKKLIDDRSVSSYHYAYMQQGLQDLSIAAYEVEHGHPDIQQQPSSTYA